MAKYLEKFSTALRIIRENGGLKESYMVFYRTDDLKTGTLIGEDEFGNKYFQNKKYFFGRSRWVIYNKKFNVDYDGSMIPPAWHRWLHYIGDVPPSVSPPVSKPWMSPHIENPSGTCKEYVPYSTTRPKIESWKPSQ
ncbi:NADH dehydrogenase [ubiquinone] 1 alpha subcomplex subunit 12 [Octopus bimaculoides]|uniref:NADH dehydrogenase [ubiquinone] 1 alpha subcomplex subunit 12 n=1 Tax=Octopus bimaculoides TaxID=37653 RepID=A0A0L8GAQ2_OCTBM|nr:NADH dehydrogenase [ubiquinone] 1 alpha subcomplex subunit 12 [Octopus bimaculoides]|eukprot:XP_014782793.1 PREDICTED: NADH dehydrogenase [ubiquinone] 1 alpha subcomplex subunit 12-like [Octopus bimaculoides]